MAGSVATTVTEQVRMSATATLQTMIPTSQQITPDYMVYRTAPLPNTFLNFIDDDDQSRLMSKRRSRSIPNILSSIGRDQEARVKACKASTAVSTEDALSDDAASTNCEVASTGLPCDTVDSDEAESETSVETEAKFTTIMLQNLPQVFSQVDLLEALDKFGLQDAYDFCYVPVSFRDGSCRGYAFINFTMPSSASWLLSAWQGSTRFCDRYHRKPLFAAVAGVQGLDALMAQSSMKKLQRVKNPAFRPYVASFDSV
mmetsp:Transcript_42192/g.96860  ORF Transcript_42192/g.96860 Transcript_42192/m.96860 type:complete len:257 (-) Transcript_42192:158-928(-)